MKMFGKEGKGCDFSIKQIEYNSVWGGLQRTGIVQDIQTERPQFEDGRF
jgi:hypothetical protein